MSALRRFSLVLALVASFAMAALLTLAPAPEAVAQAGGGPPNYVVETQTLTLEPNLSFTLLECDCIQVVEISPKQKVTVGPVTSTVPVTVVQNISKTGLVTHTISYNNDMTLTGVFKVVGPRASGGMWPSANVSVPVTVTTYVGIQDVPGGLPVTGSSSNIWLAGVFVLIGVIFVISALWRKYAARVISILIVGLSLAAFAAQPFSAEAAPPPTPTKAAPVATATRVPEGVAPAATVVPSPTNTPTSKPTNTPNFVASMQAVADARVASYAQSSAFGAWVQNTARQAVPTATPVNISVVADQAASRVRVPTAKEAWEAGRVSDNGFIPTIVAAMPTPRPGPQGPVGPSGSVDWFWLALTIAAGAFAAVSGIVAILMGFTARNPVVSAAGTATREWVLPGLGWLRRWLVGFRAARARARTAAPTQPTTAPKGGTRPSGEE